VGAIQQSGETRLLSAPLPFSSRSAIIRQYELFLPVPVTAPDTGTGTAGCSALVGSVVPLWGLRRALLGSKANWWGLRRLGGICVALMGSEMPWCGLRCLGGVSGALVGSVVPCWGLGFLGGV